jgi:transposase
MIDIKVEDLRPAMIWLNKKKGMGKEKIAELFGIPKKTVTRAVQRYEEQGDFKDRPRSGRRVTATTAARQEEMEAALNEDSHTRVNSTRKLAAKMNVSRTSVQRMLKKAGYRSWKDQRRQALNESQMQKRRERCPELLERYPDCHDADGLPVLFTDEKLFTVEQAHNRQNDRRWSRGAPPKAIRVVQRAVKPKSVMVWAGVGHNLKSPLVIVPQGVKINADVYLDMLEREVLPWLDEMRVKVVFQQDGAPAHTAKSTQEWFEMVFHDKFIRKAEWPPSSCDLNPMDYSIWDLLERDACAVPHKSVESLISALHRAWERLDQETINRAVAQFPTRLQACIDAQGGHFE